MSLAAGGNPSDGGASNEDAGASPGGASAGDGGTGEASDGGDASGQAGAAGSAAVDTSVRGKVMHALGGPLPGWQVVIGGNAATTDSAGEFTIPDVGETYDLTVAASERHLRLYQGLSTREPIAVMSLMAGDPGWTERACNLEGTVSNRFGPELGAVEVWYGEQRLSVAPVMTMTPPPAPGVFGFDVTWNHGDDPLTLELIAFQTNGESWRVGKHELAAAAGADYSGIGIALQDVVSRVVTATAELAPGVTLTSVAQCLGLHCATTLPFGLGARNARVELAGTHAAGTTKTIARVADDENDVTLPLTGPPAALAPPDDSAAVGLGTEYSWQPYADGIHILEIAAEGYLVEVYTTRTSFALAEIPGATYGTGTHTWRVRGVGPFTSVDELVSESAPLSLKRVDYLTESTARSFMLE